MPVFLFHVWKKKGNAEVAGLPTVPTENLTRMLGTKCILGAAGRIMSISCLPHCLETVLLNSADNAGNKLTTHFFIFSKMGTWVF